MIKVLCLLISKYTTFKARVICGVFKTKQNKTKKQQKTADWESPPRFQTICDFSGIVYRTEPEKIFPANKPEFSL